MAKKEVKPEAEVKVELPVEVKATPSLEERFNKLVDYINDQVKVAGIGGDPFRSFFNN